ncbi:hypothetical protein BDQ12DRAFT_720102 [Crucibulum laeve]|uniref:Beta/gamma crystallin 'Greek key' domain-containing protein n=1 Tax=Crucibulum laeve TaxID=68775 RepID=A0A5C3MBS6_9AGAR|nr:hypothetical protein BDQ12DRAFT_720102 [Crucibulum laeve]
MFSLFKLTLVAVVAAACVSAAVVHDTQSSSDAADAQMKRVFEHNDGQKIPASSSAGSAVITANLLICEHADMHGRCRTFTYTNGTCYNLPSDFNDVISSVAPQGDGHNCTLWEDYNCTGQNVNVNRYMPALDNFNDRASSFSCSA